MLIGGLEQKIALIHFYLGVDLNIADPLDGEFLKLWNRLEFALEFEKKLA